MVAEEDSRVTSRSAESCALVAFCSTAATTSASSGSVKTSSATTLTLAERTDWMTTLVAAGKRASSRKRKALRLKSSTVLATTKSARTIL